MLTSKIALTAFLAATMTFAVANVASAKSKRVHHRSQELQTAPVYLAPEHIISGYRNTPENWVPPPATGGGVG